MLRNMSTVKYARKGSVNILSEVQHTKYLLRQKSSEFANCLSKEHLIGVRFAVVGMQESVLFCHHSATTCHYVDASENF